MAAVLREALVDTLAFVCTTSFFDNLAFIDTTALVDTLPIVYTTSFVDDLAFIDTTVLVDFYSAYLNAHLFCFTASSTTSRLMKFFALQPAAFSFFQL